jgi:transcriptional regulator with PAS, ATPase and Fis domain
LLRVLETGEYFPVGETRAKKADVRIISATNQDLPDLIRKGKFREDLFYRIHVINIELPPLRDRMEDIPLLTEFFLSRFQLKKKKPLLTGKILDALSHYEWPGNVRELQNAIQRFIATNQISLSIGSNQIDIGKEDLVSYDRGLNRIIGDVELKVIRETLQKTGWNRSKAADLLEISRWTLQRKMQKHGLVE